LPGDTGLIDGLKILTAGCRLVTPPFVQLDVDERVPTRNIIWPLACTNAIEAQAKIKGRSSREWELPTITDNIEIVVVEGRWSLPHRG
jgi:hypothetical protein